jgi:prenyltransferase beta subunit
VNTSSPHPSGIDRRTFLKTLAVAGVAGFSPAALGAEAPPLPSWAEATLAYLQTLARPDGGYAWADQDESHITPTWAVVGCYSILAQTPPNGNALAEFIRTHHPLRRKKIERELHLFEQQQIQSLLWLKADATEFKEKVKSWIKPVPYMAVYEQNARPIMQQELAALVCRKLLGMPMDDAAPAFNDYLNDRRRPNGSFNHSAASDGSDGHVTNTLWGLLGLDCLGRLNQNKESTIAWLRSCQLPTGHFIYQPKAEVAISNDVVVTWAALVALKLLGSVPSSQNAAVRYLHSLYNADGGFGNRPGWPSNPVATYYALGALAILEALQARPDPGARGMLSARKPAPDKLPADLKLFTAQIEAPGHGSPADAVELARSLRIHLWGAKNSPAGWIEKAQALADRLQVPVTFFVANEEYGTFVTVPGLGTYSHTSDLFAPPGVDFGPAIPSPTAHTWESYREKRLAPLQKANGRVFWQFGENEEITRFYLDDSLNRGGYAAISTFHFGNPDFTNSSPFLYQYNQIIPFIALQDAHGGESWWWSDMLTGFRTVFLATEPTYEGWMTALKNNWVTAIRRDTWTDFKVKMHGGAPGMQEFVKAHRQEWQWWDSPTIAQPLVSMVALTPQDEFEAGKPQKGLTIRIRTRWEHTTQGLPKKQVVELASLVVDGQRVETQPVGRKGAKGATSDHLYKYDMPALAGGAHTATATVRVIETKQEAAQTIRF